MAQLAQLVHLENLERSIGEVASTTCQQKCDMHTPRKTGCQKGKSVLYQI